MTTTYLVTAQGAEPAAQDQYLCQAWGETDLPVVAIVAGLEAVRAFLVAHWLGDAEHEYDNGTKTLPAVMEQMQEGWALEGAAWKWAAEFEIGGISVQKVFHAAAPQAPIAPLDLSAFEKARFGVFNPDGRFEEIPEGVSPCGWAEAHPCGHTARWVGGPRDVDLLRAVLASAGHGCMQLMPAPQPERPPTPITALVMEDDAGAAPAFCVMAAYRTRDEASAAFDLLGLDALLAEAPGAQEADPETSDPVEGTAAGWKSHAEAMERERDYYRQRVRTLDEHQEGQVWYWQNDGGDHLETMVNSLPVVIRADQLRALLAVAARPPADAGAPMAVPEGLRLVPGEFVRGFSILAHNYSLQAEPPFYYDGRAGDAFSDAYRRCGKDLAELRAILDAAPQPTSAPQAPAKAAA